MSRALVVLNPAAGGGRAETLYRRVDPAVRRLVSCDLVRTDAQGRWAGAVSDALAGGTRIFIAAGGDGTVNLLLNALVRRRRSVPLHELSLGAVGLGSSNDFHKPAGQTLRGVPVKLDPIDAGWRDICLARYLAPDGRLRWRCFAVSASLGVTAEANAFFNGGDALMRLLKRGSTDLGILYAACRTIATYRGFAARLGSGSRGDGPDEPVTLTNLSLLKTPYLSGALRYDTPVEADSGEMAVNLCEGMNRRQTAAALCGLMRGSFLGRPNTRHRMAGRLQAELDRPRPLELDGEVVLARAVRFEVLPQKVRVCN